MEGNVRRCQTCKGQGRIYKEVSPGKWHEIRCPDCCDDGTT